MSGHAVGRRQSERELAAIQATRRADVYRTAQIKNRSREVQLLAHLGRSERKGYLQHVV